MTVRLRVAYAGTPAFAVPALQALHESFHEVVLVLTQPDRPAGRGLDVRESAVKTHARALGLSIFQPDSLRGADSLGPLHGLRPDLLVVAAYGLILPQRVLDLPRLACVNIHASLLPRWRGAAPIQRAIAAGDQKSGISIMEMEAGLDTGPVYLARQTPIRADETGSSLHDRLAELGAAALLEALPGIASGTLSATAQDCSLATYAPKIEKSEARIDWARPAAEIERLVRAFDPWPVSDTLLEGRQLRIWSARVAAGVEEQAGTEAPHNGAGRVSAGGAPARAPGTVVEARARFLVATGAGLLQIDRVQPAGKRAMDADAFLNARRDLEGIRLG